MNKWTELLSVWNSKMPTMSKGDSFFFRSLRWFFAAFLLFAIINYVGLYHLIAIAHPVGK